MSDHSPAGLVTALPSEAASARALRDRGIVQLGCSGIGARAAGIHAEALIQAGAEVLISWGCAGALTPGLRAGTLLLPEAVTDPAGVTFGTDVTIRNQLFDALAPLAPQGGLMVAADGIITSAAERQTLSAQTGACAVDMESAAIARSARAAGVRFVMVRAVADGPGLALEALAPLDSGTAQIVAGLLRRPHTLPVLLQLAWNYHRALRRLRQAAQKLARTAPGALATARPAHGGHPATPETGARY